MKNISLQHFIGLLITFLLALAWLLPNHAVPWTTFHSEAWMAIVFALIGLIALVFAKGKLKFYLINVVTLLVIPLPFIQFYFGLLPFFGQAAISAAYIAGFLFAQIAGQQLQAWRPSWIGNIFFGAILTAVIPSVGMQLFQWLGFARDSGLTAIWIATVDTLRPSANLAQPNLLATLILWGIMSVLWFNASDLITKKSCVLIFLFLLVGLALTQSRSGLLGLFLLLVVRLSLSKHNDLFPGKGMAVILAVLCILFVWLIKPMSQWLLLDDMESISARPSGQARLLAWRMFLDAIADKPWFGYGWNNVMEAHLHSAERHPEVGQLFAQTHNLFLDLLVWTGIPTGFSLFILMTCWLWAACKKLTNRSQSTYFLIILLAAMHSMVEFPLHHVYFLLPVGLVVGVLNESLDFHSLFRFGAVGRVFVAAGLCSLLVVLAFVVRDYFLLESASTSLRFQNARVGSVQKINIPNSLLINQLKEQLNFFLLQPVAAASADELRSARQLSAVFPSYHNMLKLITLLALSQHTDEAQQWMRRCPALLDKDARRQLFVDWLHIQSSYPTLNNFSWIADGAPVSNVVTDLSPP